MKTVRLIILSIPRHREMSGNVFRQIINVMECTECKLVILSSFDHIKNGFYESSHFITLFHVLKHLEDPAEYLSKLAIYLKESMRVKSFWKHQIRMMRCNLYIKVKPFLISHAGVLIYIYIMKRMYTLLSEKAGLSVKWMKQIQRYPLLNHLYWITSGLPEGIRYGNL